MFRRDENLHLVYIQDDSAKVLYDVDDYTRRLNQSLSLMKDKEEGSPSKQYRATLIGVLENDDYNSFLKNRVYFADQIARLARQLKARHLPIAFPDTDHFFKSFQDMQKLDGKDYDRALVKDSQDFAKSLESAIQKNCECARANKINYELPKLPTETDKIKE